MSNFEIQHLEILLNSAKVKPVVNQVSCHTSTPQSLAVCANATFQIYLNPYALVQQAALLEYCAKHDIVIEAYSPLV